jgi:hypothetical protein
LWQRLKGIILLFGHIRRFVNSDTVLTLNVEVEIILSIEQCRDAKSFKKYKSIIKFYLNN